MRAVPLELREANSYVALHHRHHAPVHRDKYRVGCVDGEGKLVGVIQVGRPVSRYLDDGRTLEVVRCCTNGEKNVCSFLYARAARIAREMGYSRIITYTLLSEEGASLRVANWTIDREPAGGGRWDCPSRRRQSTVLENAILKTKYPTGKKCRWVKIL